MKFFTVSSKRFILFLLALSMGCISEVYAQVSSASVSGANSNRLVVNLSSRTTIANSQGWYLVGGGAEVKRLLGGSGTSTLTFELTDYVLPDDDFTLYYYEELGNAVSNGSRTRSAERVSVSTSSVSSYRGNGKIYYVSRSGSSGSSGTSQSQPTTFANAISRANAGDYVLLKKGESWSSPLNIKNKRGTTDRYITVGTYGGGSMPVISGNATTIEVRDSHYLQVVGLEARPTSGSRSAGVRILGDSRYCKIRSLKITGQKQYSDGTGEGSGISYSSQSGSGKFPYHSIIMHCDVSSFRDGIYGYKINGGGDICFNKVSYCSIDGIRAFDGDTNGIIIGHNEITKFSDDGVDLFDGSNVIVQYNEIHDPISPHSGGANNGIKAGGASSSRDNIIRYNTIYNIFSRGNSPNAITTNGAVSGEIYGNLCYNIDDNAIEITATQRNRTWKVHHNTAISNRANAFIVAPDNPDVIAYNNIFRGAISDIRVNGSSRVSGKNNILVNNKKAGNYSSSGDFSTSTAVLFDNYDRKDFHLRNNSPAIDRGVAINGYGSDIIGKRVSGKNDIGCYEYGAGTSADPTPEPEPPTGSTAGLAYKYYEGNWNSLPNFNGQSVVKQGKVSNFSLSPRARGDYFGMVFEGQIKIDRAGQYQFYTNSDDGVKLFVKGQQIVSDDGTHAARERSGSINLTAGVHSIRVEYFERKGSEVLEVRYQGPGVGKQRIPDSKLSQPSSNNQRISAQSEKGDSLLSDEIPGKEILAYPNPIQDELTIELPSLTEELEIKFINSIGAVVWHQRLPEASTRFSVDLDYTSITPGYYLLIIMSENKMLYSDKVLKE